MSLFGVDSCSFPIFPSLPTEIDQNKDRMLEILEGKSLSFLFPLMKLEKELLKQIKADPAPQTVYKWIKDNISLKLHTEKGFVNILMTRYDDDDDDDGPAGRNHLKGSVYPWLTPPNSSSFLQYIFHEMYSTEEEEQLSSPTKEQLDQEKQLLLAFKPVMQKFLHDHVDLQVSALYALQVHCNAHTFPKGASKNGGISISPSIREVFFVCYK